jgi:asparagine synthase (glutamine-hydrolysing)
MAHSRELRLPFLDRSIAGFALSLPPEYLFAGGVTKRVLRDAVRGIVPDAVLDRRDKGRFETPEARWFALPEFRSRAAEVLLDPAVRERGLYDTGAIEHDLRAERWRSAPALWRALNVELWRGQFARGRSAPAAALARS